MDGLLFVRFVHETWNVPQMVSQVNQYVQEGTCQDAKYKQR